MKKLKKGTLVYHRSYGQGIIWNKDESYSDTYNVLFADLNHLISCIRKDLFIKGDKVYYSISSTEFCKKDQIGLYRGFVPFFTGPKIFVSQGLATNTFSVWDIVHIDEEPEIEITIKVNGKDVKLSSISEETLLEIRKNS